MVTSAEERRAGAPARPRPEDAEATPAASGPVVAREERNRARQLWAVRCGAARCSRAPSGAVRQAGPRERGSRIADAPRLPSGSVPPAPCSAVCRCGSAGCGAGSAAGGSRTYLKRSAAFPSPDRGTATNNAR